MAETKHVLIVEDDEDICMIEEAYLEAAGFATKIVADGTKVMAAIQDEQPDLVLLTKGLPSPLHKEMKIQKKYGYKICGSW